MKILPEIYCLVNYAHKDKMNCTQPCRSCSQLAALPIIKKANHKYTLPTFTDFLCYYFRWSWAIAPICCNILFYLFFNFSIFTVLNTLYFCPYFFFFIFFLFSSSFHLQVTGHSKIEFFFRVTPISTQLFCYITCTFKRPSLR